MANFTAEQIAANTKAKYGKCLCVECGQKEKARLEAQASKVQPQSLGDMSAEQPEPQIDLAAELMAAAEQ